MNVQIRRCECGDRGYIRGNGANQAGAVISGAAAVVLRQPPSDQQSGQGLADLNPTNVGSQTDPAQGKGTLALSIKRGRLEDGLKLLDGSQGHGTELDA